MDNSPGTPLCMTKGTGNETMKTSATKPTTRSGVMAFPLRLDGSPGPVVGTTTLGHVCGFIKGGRGAHSCGYAKLWRQVGNLPKGGKLATCRHDAGRRSLLLFL